ncbi:MAG TPA: trypsin-like peptidase domain-containing protein [Candidatus Acidoferrales bacterium]|nr:trypsin-like peptidase domain-containing protein [Candidatus Acidoferrales bacterium]
MDTTREKIVIVEADPVTREALRLTLDTAGYDLAAFGAATEALDAIHSTGANLLLMNALSRDASGADGSHPRETIATIRGSAATEMVRVILLVGSGPEQRADALNFGADDAISQPWDSNELLARVRTQLRMFRAQKRLRDEANIAIEGQQIAHTAFEALAVTEKMANDATSLDHKLKIGFGAICAIVAVMAGVYFLFARSAQKETQRGNAIIARFEGGIVRQQDLISESRKLRTQQGAAANAPAAKVDLQKQAADLKAQMANADPDDASSLQKQLEETNARLARIEQEGQGAQTLIPADVQSVCLLHVSVALRDKDTGQRLRYAGLNQQGQPLQDSGGDPILTLEGHGPEVKIDVFGTGFVAGPNGRVMTNHHVAEPWWKTDDFKVFVDQGYQPEISTIRAYFPGDPRAFHAEVQQISPETDLATMRVDLQDLKRPVLLVDWGQGAAVTGQPVILMGYATGLAAILARTDEDTAQEIIAHNGIDTSKVLDELAHRNLIRPLITQGHIGDILPDKIVFDAQTTNGGSGGPLFNRKGKVIGVTYAVLRGFGGSNFGIPIKFSQPLLGAAPPAP